MVFSGLICRSVPKTVQTLFNPIFMCGFTRTDGLCSAFMKPSVFHQIAQSDEIILKCKAHVPVLLYLKKQNKQTSEGPD